MMMLAFVWAVYLGARCAIGAAELFDAEDYEPPLPSSAYRGRVQP
jgi:hypothetical protein